MAQDKGFINVKTSIDQNSATFEVKEGFDFAAKLNEIAEDTSQVKGWSKK